MSPSPKSPNPKRVAAGRLNRLKRAGLTPAGAARLSQAARDRKPWEHSTGPRTAAGKARSAANGASTQTGPGSVRAARREVAGVRDLLAGLAEARVVLARIEAQAQAQAR